MNRNTASGFRQTKRGWSNFMSKKFYTVLAVLQAKPGKETILKEALFSLIQPTLQEEGCINYDFYENLNIPGQFMFYENWSSPEAHQNHDKSSHINTVREKLNLMADHADVSFWGKVEAL